MTEHLFYDELSSIEKTYWHQLSDLFELVSPQKPEKGIKTLILRARSAARHPGSNLETELEKIFQGARNRTLKRVALLSACQIPDSPNA